MRTAIAKSANVFFRPMGLKVSNREGQFGMSNALQRLANHDFKIGSIVDIGASDGPWSEMAMEYLPGVRCLAIEALEEQRSSLERIKQHHRQFDFSICAAGERDGSLQFMVSPVLDWSGVTAQKGTPRDVPCRTIDTLVRDHGLPGPYLLKFDTHGYELPILAGAVETLKQTEVIIMEVYNFQPCDIGLRFPQMCLHLEQLGFRCYDMAGPMFRKLDEAFWQMDLCFARADAPLFQNTNYK